MSEVQQEQPVIESANELANVVIIWHQNVVAQLGYMGNIPEGVSVKTTAYGEEREFTPDELVAFQEGIKSALSAVQTLPFTYTPAPEASNG